MIFRAVEDTDLISRIRKSGDVEAFNLLITRWEKRVFNYLLRLTARSDDALDLTQDSFLKAWQNISKLDDPTRFGPWLYRIAHNEAYSFFRKRRPETATEDLSLAEQAKLNHSGRAIPLDLTLTVSTALDKLTPEQREAVVLKVYEGFKFEEMAQILDCPVSTIKSRLYTALDLLKTQLTPVAARGAR